MSFNWREHSAEVLEQHFNPRLTVANFQAEIDRYLEKSAQARARISGEYDLAYGDQPGQTFDLHKAAAERPPLLMFIHGGFWRALDKNDHSFVAPIFVDNGISVANVNYTLCPKATLDEIVAEMRAAVLHIYQQAESLGFDPNRFFVAGHSAGAHLTAMLLAQDWTTFGLPQDAIKGGIALSGIYQPEVVMHISVNEDVRLNLEIAQRNNAFQQPPHHPVPILITAGGAEPEGWIQQTLDYETLCREAGSETQLMIVDGANHFSLVDIATTPGEPLAQAMIDLIKQH